MHADAANAYLQLAWKIDTAVCIMCNKGFSHVYVVRWSCHDGSLFRYEAQVFEPDKKHLALAKARQKQGTVEEITFRRIYV